MSENRITFCGELRERSLFGSGWKIADDGDWTEKGDDGDENFS